MATYNIYEVREWVEERERVWKGRGGKGEEVREERERERLWPLFVELELSPS